MKSYRDLHIYSYFHPLKVVRRSTDTQLQVGKN